LLAAARLGAMVHAPWSHLLPLVAFAVAVGFSEPPQSHDTVKLRNGVVMPRLAMGAGYTSDSETSLRVQAALNAGYHHIDTALNYKTQHGVSLGLAAAGVRREDVFITTKVPGCGLEGVDQRNCFNSTLAAVEEDLQLLGSAYPVKHVDLLLLHYPPCMEADPSAPQWMNPCVAKQSGCSDKANCQAIQDQWNALRDVYKRGLARAIGVSMFCQACFRCIGGSGELPMVNQVRYQLGMGPDRQGFLSFAASQGMVLQAANPLEDENRVVAQMIIHGILTTNIGNAHNKTPVQVALKWLEQHQVSILTMSSNPEHLREDLDLFSWQLSAHEMDKLDNGPYFDPGPPSFLCTEPESETALDVVM